jgi:hypothetical protein
MKLTVFNAETMPQGAFGERSTLPKIVLGKVGSITINKGCADLVGIKSGDAVSFAQDDDGNWYIYLDPTGFKARQHSDQRSLTFSHSQMAKAIKDSFALKGDESLHFLVAGQPTVHGKVKYWGLIIKQA